MDLFSGAIPGDDVLAVLSSWWAPEIGGIGVRRTGSRVRVVMFAPKWCLPPPALVTPAVFFVRAAVRVVMFAPKWCLPPPALVTPAVFFVRAAAGRVIRGRTIKGRTI